MPPLLTAPSPAGTPDRPQAPGRLRLRGLGLAAVGAAAAIELGRRLVGPGAAGRFLATFGALPLLVLAAGLHVGAARRSATGPRVRRGLRLLAVALALAVVGRAAAAAGEETVAQAALLARYGPLLVGLLLLADPQRDPHERRRVALDLVTTGTAAAVVLAHYLGSPEVRRLGASLLPLAHPLADLVVVVSVPVLVARRTAGLPPAALTALRTAVGLQFLGNTVWAMFAVRGAHPVGGVADTLATMSAATWAVAGDLARRAAADAPAPTARPDEPPSARLHPLPYAALGLACAVLVVECALGPPGAPVDLAVGVSVLVATVALRQAYAVRQNAALLGERARLLGEAQLSALVRHAADAVWVLDRDGRVRWASPSSEAVLGVRPDRVVGRALAAALGADGAVWPDDVLRRALEAPRASQRAEGPAAPAGGAAKRVEVTVTNLLDEAPVHGLVANLHDVTERARLEDELTHQAFHDPLTGLANRALFADRVQHALSRCARTGASVAVCILDLDDFKTVNDGLGHGAGDALLAQVARRIRAQVRDADTAARLGGDEFAVLTEDLEHAGGATGIGERLCDAFRAPFDLDGHEVFVTASVGLATARPGDDGESLVRNADTAMYVAKGRARGEFALYEPAMHAAARESLELHNLMRAAIERDEVFLHYQPVHRLSTGAVVAVEALARWTPPDRAPVPPSTFIPLAERSGLIVPLGQAILRRALTEAAAAVPRWPRGRAPILTVNVSARQLQDAAFADEVHALLMETGYDPRLLCIELTESVFVQRSEGVREALERIRRLGVKIGIDDFGTGYSSLATLHRFPLDVLKIPREFVEPLGGAGGSTMLAQSIVALGAAMGLRTIAEGVENDAQVAALRALGCDWGQGFRFGAPAPLDEVLAATAAKRDGWLSVEAAPARSDAPPWREPGASA